VTEIAGDDTANDAMPFFGVAVKVRKKFKMRSALLAIIMLINFEQVQYNSRLCSVLWQSDEAQVW
jgi:hypothetical protein